MKRRLAILTGAITFITILSTGGTTAYAAPVQAAGCVAFVDENGDGICDSCGVCVGFVDEDGDGICDNWNVNAGTGCGYGIGYVDENGDGICDNWNANAGWGRGYGRRNGCGRNGRGNGCGRGGRW